jgi:rhodanese-related sulfurtransferase
MLIDRGVTDIGFLQGGFEAWRRAGYPLDPK